MTGAIAMPFKRVYPVKPEQRVIFIHIPKCGGTSVHDFLEASTPLRQMPPTAAQLAQFCEPSLHKHVKARDLYAIVGSDLWESTGRLAVVRNPWDLMVSSYCWWLEKAHRFSSLRNDASEVAKLGDFSSFIKSEYGGNRINECEGNPQDWFMDEKGADMVTSVARFETLDDDLALFCEKAEITPGKALPRLNFTVRTGYRDYYNTETRNTVAKRFSYVIDRFEYAF